MSRKTKTSTFIAVALFGLGLTFFFQVLVQSFRYTILSHSLEADPVRFVIFFLALSLIVSVALAFGGKALSRLSGLDRDAASYRFIWVLSPLIFLLLSPLLLLHYLTRQDLGKRLGLLALLVVLAMLYLLFSEVRPLLGRVLARLQKWELSFSSRSPGKKTAVLFLAAFLIYQGMTLLLVEEGVTFSGDEPYYLMTTHSLYRDGDINLANNYANQDYFSFYSKKDNPRLKLGVYGRSGRKGKGTIYPINLPGVSVLMLPFYSLSRLFSGKTLTFILKGSLSVWAVLLGLQLYLFIQGLWKKERLSLLIWFLYSFSVPVVFFATHLYPEVIVALFSLTVFRAAASADRLTGLQSLFLGFMLGTLPWFGLKYALILGPLALVALYFFRLNRRPFKHMALLMVFPVVSVLLFFAFIYNLYGTFSLLSVYEGVMSLEEQAAFKSMVLSIPLGERIDAFFDYFLDQRDGLLLYSPVYFLALLGFVEIFKRSKRMFWSLLAICLPFLLNYAFLTHRQGHSPPARVLMPLSWAGAVAIGYFLAYNRKKFFAFLSGFLGISSLILAGLLAGHPVSLYQPTTHEFTVRAGELFAQLSNLHLFLPAVLPSFIKVNNLGYWPNYAWAAAILAFVLVYALSRGEWPLGRIFHRLFVLALFSACFVLWVLFPRTVPYGVKTVAYTPQRSLGFYLGPMGEGVVAKEAGDFYLHRAKAYKLFFGSKNRLEKLKIVYGSEKGQFGLRAELFDLPLVDDRTDHETKERIIRPEAFYRANELFYYEINLKISQFSDEPMLVDPYLFQVVPVRD